MYSVYKSMKVIIIITVIMLFIQTAFGDKASEKMGMIILFSMVIYQSDTVANWLNGISTTLTSNLESGKSTVHVGAGNRVSGGGSKQF